MPAVYLEHNAPQGRVNDLRIGEAILQGSTLIIAGGGEVVEAPRRVQGVDPGPELGRPSGATEVGGGPGDVDAVRPHVPGDDHVHQMVEGLPRRHACRGRPAGGDRLQSLRGVHRIAEDRLANAAARNGVTAPVVTSAGALIATYEPAGEVTQGWAGPQSTSAREIERQRQMEAGTW